MLGYYEQAMGMGEPQTAVGNIGAVVAQFFSGGLASMYFSPKERSCALLEGGVAAVAATQASQSIMPLSGLLYWVRAIGGGVGMGILIGLWHQKQWRSELQASYELDKAYRLAARSGA